MIKDRRLWFLGPVLIGLLLLVAQPRRVSHAPPPDPAGSPAVADTERTDSSETVAPTAGGEPRHPEIGFRTRDRLAEHFRKHGREFHVNSADDYLRLAQTLRDRPKGGDVLEFVRNDAVTCKFDRETGAFVAYDSDGTLRTFFRPRDGAAYFQRQKHRPAGAP